MIKAKGVFLILAFSTIGLMAGAQERFKVDTVVKGRVLGAGRFETILVKCKVSVFGTDGTELEFMTNDLGEYFLTNKQIKPCNSYVFSFHEDYEEGNAWFMNYTAAIREPEFNEDSLPLIRDTKVSLRYGRFTLPNAFFDKNSSVLNERALTSIDQVIEELTDSPRFIVEVGGHAYPNESNPDSLALARAQKVAALLIVEGVASYRVNVVSYGEKLPHVVRGSPEFNSNDTLSANYIQSLMDSSKVKYAKELNRFVDFSLIGWINIPDKN